MDEVFTDPDIGSNNEFNTTYNYETNTTSNDESNTTSNDESTNASSTHKPTTERPKMDRVFEIISGVLAILSIGALILAVLAFTKPATVQVVTKTIPTVTPQAIEVDGNLNVDSTTTAQMLSNTTDLTITGKLTSSQTSVTSPVSLSSLLFNTTMLTQLSRMTNYVTVTSQPNSKFNGSSFNMAALFAAVPLVNPIGNQALFVPIVVGSHGAAQFLLTQGTWLVSMTVQIDGIAPSNISKMMIVFCDDTVDFEDTYANNIYCQPIDIGSSVLYGNIFTLSAVATIPTMLAPTNLPIRRAAAYFALTNYGNPVISNITMTCSQLQ